MNRLRIVVAAGLAVGMLAAGAPLVHAQSQGIREASSSDSMLRKADISAVMGLSAPLTRRVGTAPSNEPVLCNQANQNLIHGPRALANDSVDVSQRDLSGVVQTVYDYGSAASAGRAFARMVRLSRQCDQLNSLPAAGPGHVQLLTTGRAPVQYGGVRGLWTREVNGRLGAKGPITYDAYSLTLLLGDSIQQVTLSFFDAGRTADVQRSAIDTLALQLAARWEAAASGPR